MQRHWGDDEGGDRLNWCYGGFALASISDSGGTTYTVPHLLGAPQASRWCAAFVEAVCFYGQAVNAQPGIEPITAMELPVRLRWQLI